MNAAAPKKIANMSSPLFIHTAFFAVFCAAGLGVFWEPLRELAVLSRDNSLYSHIGLIPFFSLAIIVFKRHAVFCRIVFAPATGAAVVLAGVGILIAGKIFQPELGHDSLSISTTAFLLWIIGGFVGFYGRRAFQRAMFPLLFLFFIVPIPTVALERSVRFLQHMSADTVDGIFGIIGLTYFRTDTVFQLPGLTMEVADQCSGIRSSLALVVATTAAGYVFLENGWNRLILVLAILPITIFKNALRITTLTLMAAYVDPTWLTDSWLHRAGGKPFFLVALLLWSPILWLLWRAEKKRRTQGEAKGTRRQKGRDDCVPVETA
jgi:exosortase